MAQSGRSHGMFSRAELSENLAASPLRLLFRLRNLLGLGKGVVAVAAAAGRPNERQFHYYLMLLSLACWRSSNSLVARLHHHHFGVRVCLLGRDQDKLEHYNSCSVYCPKQTNTYSTHAGRASQKLFKQQVEWSSNSLCVCVCICI